MAKGYAVFYFIGNCVVRRINSQVAKQLAKNHGVILFYAQGCEVKIAAVAARTPQWNAAARTACGSFDEQGKYLFYTRAYFSAILDINVLNENAR